MKKNHRISAPSAEALRVLQKGNGSRLCAVLNILLKYFAVKVLASIRMYTFPQLVNAKCMHSWKIC